MSFFRTRRVRFYMESDDLIVAVVALLAFVAMAPVWVHYLGQFAPPLATDLWLARLVLPAAILLFLVSWISPTLAGPVQGALVLVGVMALAPWLWRATGMASDALAQNPLAALLMRGAMSVLVLAAVAGLGYQRVVVAR